MLDLKKVQKQSKPQWGRKIRNVLVREKSKMNRLGSLKNLAKKLLPRRGFQPRWKQRIYWPTGFYHPPHPMNIFVWNIRDLGSSREFNILQSYKQEIKPELMFLIETKFEHKKLENWRLVKLPCSPNVDEILNRYCDYSSKKDGLRADSTEEIVKGLQCYFDKALPVMLLYKTEHQQYEDAVAVGHSPSTIYGADHLLCLFVKLPELLVHIKIEEDTERIAAKLVEFLKFLRKNQSAFFLSTYPVAEDVETSTNKQDE